MAEFNFPIPQNQINNNTIVRRREIPIKKSCDSFFLEDPCCGWNETHCSSDLDYFQPVCAPAISLEMICEKKYCEDTGLLYGKTRIDVLVFPSIEIFMLSSNIFAYFPIPSIVEPFGTGFEITNAEIQTEVLNYAVYYPTVPILLRYAHAFARLYGERAATYVNQLFQDGFLSYNPDAVFDVSVQDNYVKVSLIMNVNDQNFNYFCDNASDFVVKYRFTDSSNWNVFNVSQGVDIDNENSPACCYGSKETCEETGMRRNTTRIDLKIEGIPDFLSPGNHFSMTVPFSPPATSSSSYSIPVFSAVWPSTPPSNPLLAFAEMYATGVVNTYNVLLPELEASYVVTNTGGDIYVSITFSISSMDVALNFCGNVSNMVVYGKSGAHTSISVNYNDLSDDFFLINSETINVMNGGKPLCCLGNEYQSGTMSDLLCETPKDEVYFDVYINENSNYNNFIFSHPRFGQDVNEAFRNFSNFQNAFSPYAQYVETGSSYSSFDDFINGYAANAHTTLINDFGASPPPEIATLSIGFTFYRRIRFFIPNSIGPSGANPTQLSGKVYTWYNATGVPYALNHIAGIDGYSGNIPGNVSGSVENGGSVFSCSAFEDCSSLLNKEIEFKIYFSTDNSFVPPAGMQYKFTTQYMSGISSVPIPLEAVYIPGPPVDYDIQHTVCTISGGAAAPGPVFVSTGYTDSVSFFNDMVNFVQSNQILGPSVPYTVETGTGWFGWNPALSSWMYPARFIKIKVNAEGMSDEQYRDFCMNGKYRFSVYMPESEGFPYTYFPGGQIPAVGYIDGLSGGSGILGYGGFENFELSDGKMERIYGRTICCRKSDDVGWIFEGLENVNFSTARPLNIIKINDFSPMPRTASDTDINLIRELCDKCGLGYWGCDDVDLLYFQFSMPDVFNDWMTTDEFWTPTHRWTNDTDGDWLATVRVFSPYDTGCLEWEHFVYDHQVGITADEVTYQMIVINPLYLPSEFFLEFSFNLGTEIKKIYTEPYRKVTCENTIKIEGFHGKYDCNNGFYGKLRRSDSANPFIHRDVFRVYGYIEHYGTSIEREKENDRTKKVRISDRLRMRTKRIPPYVVTRIKNALSAPRTSLNGWLVEFSGEISKNYEVGEMWIIDNNFDAINNNCEKIDFLCKD